MRMRPLVRQDNFWCTVTGGFVFYSCCWSLSVVILDFLASFANDMLSLSVCPDPNSDMHIAASMIEHPTKTGGAGDSGCCATTVLVITTGQIPEIYISNLTRKCKTLIYQIKMTKYSLQTIVKTISFSMDSDGNCAPSNKQIKSP